MNYIQVDISLSEKQPFADIITAKLNEIDFESYQETDKGLMAYIQKKLFNEKALYEAFSILDKKVKFDFKIQEIKQQNWNANWESSFEPVDINNNCVIRADFHNSTDVDYEIIITPKMSFGTGHHATTFLMMNDMFTLYFRGKSVLDIGSGTGVLSILASMLGAKNIVGIDIDNWAFANAKENQKLNNCQNIDFEIGDVSKIGNRQFDIVLANINRNIILNNLQSYSNALNSGGHIILSGFYSKDEALIIDNTKDIGLKLLNKNVKENWLLLHFQK